MEKLDYLLVKFEEHLKITRYAERSIPSYVHNVKLYLDYLKSIGIQNIAAADKQVLADYQATVYLQTHKGKPLSPVTQGIRLIAVHAFYRYLLKYQYVTYDPSAHLELPKAPDQLPRNILSKKEIGEILSAPDIETTLGLRNRAILEVLYTTAIRASELCNLAVNDLNLSGRELRINQGKGGKDRMVPLGEMAADFIEIYLNEARPKLAASNQSLLFVTNHGKRIDLKSLERIVGRCCQKAGIKKAITPHCLRHTCATHLLKGKADIRQIQKLLGHASIASTQVYTRVEISDLKQVLKRHHPRERREIDTHEI